MKNIAISCFILMVIILHNNNKMLWRWHR